MRQTVNLGSLVQLQDEPPARRRPVSRPGGLRVPFLRQPNISGLIYPGVLELGYIAVLEAAAERIKGSTPFAWTNLCLLPVSFSIKTEVAPWLRSTDGSALSW